MTTVLQKSTASLSPITSAGEIKLLIGEREPDESDLLVRFCNEYMRLGPRRTLTRLAKQLVVVGLNEKEQGVAALNQYHWKYKWKLRARLYDATMESEHHESYRTEWEKITRNSAAQPHVRIGKLLILAQALEEQIFDPEVDDAKGDYENSGMRNLWVKKVAKNGEIYHEFNHPLVEQYRGVLKDIAEEVGGRRTGVDVNVNQGGEVKHTHGLDPKLEERIARIYASVPPPPAEQDIVEGVVTEAESSAPVGDLEEIPF